MCYDTYIMKKFLLIGLLFFSLPLSVIAQQPVLGLEVTPFLLDLEVDKGAEFTSQIDVANRSNGPLAITVEPRDFLPGEEGQPQFVPDSSINDPTFSLASWVNVKTETEFVIDPGEVVTVPFTLTPPTNTEQGTHYGAILFSYSGAGSEAGSEIRQSIGTFILVRYGQAREMGETKLVPSHRVLWNADKVTFENQFANTGNVHVQPKGEIYIKNMWGSIVATPFVNKDAANVLPKTDRTFLNTWYPSSFAFGRYTAESVITYGRGRLEARDKKVIWVLPLYLLVVLGVVLAIILWIILHGRHWYKRRVIHKHYKTE